MKVQVCRGKTCGANFSEYIVKRLTNDAIFYKKENVVITDCMCLGQCKKGPNVVIDGEIHNYMTPSKASELIYSPKKKKKKYAHT